MDEITYTPGRLAKKLGVSKSKLMNHLRETGLINQCGLTQHGHWRIPYSVVVKISSPEALTVSTRSAPLSRAGKSRGLRKELFPSSVDAFQPQVVGVSPPDYAQIGKTLRQAGVTMTDLIKYIERQMEVTMYGQQSQNDEKWQNNFAKRNETQRDAHKPASGGGELTTSGSTGTDIPNSSEKQ